MMKNLLARQGHMDVEQEVMRQKGLVFFKNMSLAQLITIVNGAVLASIFGVKHYPHLIGIWWGLVVALSITRLITARRFLTIATQCTSAALHWWTRWACVGALLAGLLWGSGCALFMTGDTMIRVFVVMISAGMIAGATTTLSTILVAFFCYATPILGSIVLMILLDWRGHDDAVLLLVTLLFGMVVVQSARRFYHSLAQSVRLTFELKNNEVQLQQAANVFLHSSEGIVITDFHGRIIDVNTAFTQITGYPRAKILGRRFPLLYAAKQSKTDIRAMQNTLLSQGEWSGEIWARRKNSAPYAAMLSVSAVRDERGHILNFVGLFSDISALKAHEMELKRIAHYDTLTGLPNRALLTDRLDRALSDCLRRKQSMAIVYLDLDGFKAVNDQWGHAVGDQLLVAVAHRMQHVLRQGDTLARLGGDEFVAILTHIKQTEHADTVLNRLLLAAAEPMHIDGKMVQVSASIGVTVFPQDHSDAEQLLRHADHAMYQAKQGGKNRIRMFEG